MADRFNPLDPLGILEPVKRDLDRIVSEFRLPPLPGPPGPPPERGAGLARLLDPLGLFQRRSSGTIGNPIPVEFDGRLEDLKAQARARLIAARYPERLVDGALKWHDEWLIGMTRHFAPGDTELQRRVVQSAYAEIAPRAEAWLRGIQEAFGVPMAA